MHIPRTRPAYLIVLAAVMLAFSASPVDAQAPTTRRAQPNVTPPRSPVSSATEWLSLGAKHWSATITSKSGIGTADARVEAKVTRQNLEDWCDNWHSDDKTCARDLMASGETKTTYHASADCTRGAITSISGAKYTAAGEWEKDKWFEAGRRWRDASGKIVGRDNASGGEEISQQWEVLCPGSMSAAPMARASAGGAAAVQRPPAPPREPPAPPVCGDQPFCSESLSFAATISDFQAILQNTNAKTLTLRMRLRNKLNRPLILGYVSGSGIATDDRGNRYLPAGARAVQGIGLVQGNSADPKFTLQPGEQSDARFEFVWNSSAQEIFGLTFQVDLALREIDPIPGDQIRLGREHALHFSGLGNRPTTADPAPPRQTAAPALPPVPGGPPVSPRPSAPQMDVCGGNPHCYNAGPFVAEIIRLTPSTLAYYSTPVDVLQARLRFRNLTNQPIILAYTAGSAVMTDNFGSRYSSNTPVNGDGARGIGIVKGNQVDTQFILNPGASDEATVSLSRSRGQTDRVGETVNFDMTVAQLEVLPGQQIRTVREYSVGFASLSAAAVNAGVGLVAHADACEGKPRCYSAGRFVADVAGLTSSSLKYSIPVDVLQARLRFRNLTNQPIILAYTAGSAAIVDNFGNRYSSNTPSYGDGAKGIGIASANSIDPQFVLAPGASGDVTFSLSRARGRNDRAGTTFSLDLTIARVEVLDSRQIRTIREHAVGIPDLTASGGGVGTLLNKILQELPKKKPEAR